MSRRARFEFGENWRDYLADGKLERYMPHGVPLKSGPLRGGDACPRHPESRTM